MKPYTVSVLVHIENNWHEILLSSELRREILFLINSRFPKKIPISKTPLECLDFAKPKP